MLAFFKRLAVTGLGAIFFLAAAPLYARDTLSSPLVSFQTLPALSTSSGIPGGRVPSDFNGDKLSDLLWFNPVDSQVAYWIMGASDLGVVRKGSKVFNVAPGYFVGAEGDLDGDGYADLVFTSASRDLWLWTNNRHGGWISTRIGDYPAQWQLLGSGDVNGDGQDDLLWLDPTDCEFGYWLMQGGKRIGSKTMSVGCGYYPVSIGYYSYSKQLSIFWTSPAHDLFVWDGRAPGGFTSYDLTSDLPVAATLDPIWALGGGTTGNPYTGTRIGILRREGDGSDNSAWVMTRWFDSQGRQSTVRVVNGNYTYAVDPVESAGYLIGSYATGGIYMIDASNHWIGIDPSRSLREMPFESQIQSSWTYPADWYVVGAPANHTVAPPWQ